MDQEDSSAEEYLANLQATRQMALEAWHTTYELHRTREGHPDRPSIEQVNLLAHTHRHLCTRIQACGHQEGEHDPNHRADSANTPPLPIKEELPTEELSTKAKQPTKSESLCHHRWLGDESPDP